MTNPNIEEIAARMVREAMEIRREQIAPKNKARIEQYMIPVFAQGLHRAHREGRKLVENSAIHKRLAATFMDFVRTLHEES